ncbi:MAG: oligosaccharide flippase family protein [Bacteroidales bacterium]|nr:oligosaccharide flippase family protein [Bacteroidales bacterium]
MKSRFLKEGATLLSGNVWAQGIAFAAYFVIVRLFSQEDIGLYNIFYSYIEVLIIVSTCRYELATVLASDDREAMAVSRLALRINTFVSFALLGIALLFFTIDKTFTSHLSPLTLQLSLFIPPMVFFCGTSRVYTALFNRFRDFKQIALSEAIGATSGALGKILLGLPQLAATVWHTIGLQLATVIGKIVSNINYLIALRKLPLPKDITKSERREAARKHRNFALYTMPKDLVNSLSYNLPFIWMALYFDKAEVGLFALALTFTFRPANILNNVFEKLLYVRVADNVRSCRPIARDIKRFMLYLNVIALPFFFVAFIFGDAIFGFLFGSRWSECGFYLRCLLPWVYIMLTSTSLTFISNVFSRQRTEFIFYIILFALRIVSMAIGIATSSFRTGILLFAISGALVSTALLAWYIKQVNDYERSLEPIN